MLTNESPRRRNTVAEMQEVLQAHADGKQVQNRRISKQGTALFIDVDTPLFNFAQFQYRLKPEPMTIYGLVNEHGHIVYAHKTRTNVIVKQDRHGVYRNCTIKKFVEVQE
jgi:hypothetical protein